MRTRFLTVAVVSLACAVTLAAQATISEISLDDGSDDVNRLIGPVYDTSQTGPLAVGAFVSAYDKKPHFVRRGGGNIFTRGPEYKLDPKVDVVALFTDAVGTQATAMGFASATADESAWRVTGTVRDVFLESRQVPYGATLFYGYLDVEVQLESPAGVSVTVPMSLHQYYGAYNAGMGRRDEAQAAAAHLMVEGAQELLARLNRMHIKAPPSATMSARLSTIRSGAISDQRDTLRAIGLSGLPAAIPALHDILGREGGESERSSIIDTLASLGSPESVSLLALRYTSEEEDCRWYTLKAMDYIGTADALALVAGAGLDDDDNGPKRLAQRIVGRR